MKTEVVIMGWRFYVCEDPKKPQTDEAALVPCFGLKRFCVKDCATVMRSKTCIQICP